MIDFYTFSTPNGRKVAIMLEELSVPYNVHSIDITKDEQFAPEFLQISPNNKIPAIHDHATGVTLMESGAILLYLAEKHDQFMPKGLEHWRAMQWLMWQMGGFGPMLGQVNHFLKFNPGKSEYAETRYYNEALRLYRVLDKQLEGQEYICGAYSIVDMAVWPWTMRYDWQRIDLAEFPNVLAWYRRMVARPAVLAGARTPDPDVEILQP